MQLAQQDIAVMAFEAQWPKHSGLKEAAARDRFGWSPARYYQRLNRTIDDPAALEHDPQLVKRLLRRRDARSGARSSRSFSTK